MMLFKETNIFRIVFPLGNGVGGYTGGSTTTMFLSFKKERKKKPEANRTKCQDPTKLEEGTWNGSSILYAFLHV